MKNIRTLKFLKGRIIASIMFAALVSWAPFFVAETRAQVAPPASNIFQALDSDGDGLPDDSEVKIYGTDSQNTDTDGDGYFDGDEIKNGFSPLLKEKVQLSRVDSDKDGMNDAWEIALGTGVMNPDSDGDRFLDWTEVVAGFDPLDPSPSKKISKHIYVDIKTRRMTYFFGNVMLGDVLIAIGKPKSPTPIGEFSVLAKVPLKHYKGPTWDYPNTKWNLRFTTKKGLGYYIHGAYWHHNWGGMVSGGCVNVPYADMEPLYAFAQFGTPVTIK